VSNLVFLRGSLRGARQSSGEFQISTCTVASGILSVTSVVVAPGFAFAWTAEAAVATSAVRLSLHPLWYKQ
jgi:hypothetical protein